MQRLARGSTRLLRQSRTACAEGCSTSGRPGVVPFATGAADQLPQDSIEVFVNGVATQVAKGSTVLQACDAAGIDIPRQVLSGIACLQQSIL